MPKKLYAWRLSEDVNSFIEQYKEKHKLKNVDDALRLMFQRLQYLEDLALEQAQPKLEIECKRLLKWNGKYYCVQTSPIKGLQRLKEIPTLEICKICKLERWKIPDTTQIKQEQQIVSEIRNPQRQGYAKAGMIWCSKDGLWVFPSKCEKCTNPLEECRKT
jgi:hypothetical protein